MTRIDVESSICGYGAIIKVAKLSRWQVQVVINSACELVTEMNSELKALDWREALGWRCDSTICRSSARHIHHVACPIPLAILTAIEVEVGAAAPRDIVMRLHRPQNASSP